MKRLLKKLFAQQRLSREEACEAMGFIMRGEAAPEEVAGFLGALASRGETLEEIVGCAEGLKQHALPLPVKRRDLLDVCGTGGDALHTFNISTTNALVLAASGLGVVKHGNRAVSSLSGSADVLEALGVKIDHSAERVAASVDQHGFGFLFAPLFHPAMRHVVPVRRALGIRTIFNMLGPLVNPAPVQKQVIGVFDRSLLKIMALALRELGSEEALIVHGADGLDELSISGPTYAMRLSRGQITPLQLSPADFGLNEAPIEMLCGGDNQFNAAITMKILQGQPGPTRNVVVINSAAALVIGGAAKSWREASALASRLIDSGRPLHILQDLKEFV